MPIGHEHFMRRAIELAEKGRCTVSPNPMVGCVVVKGEQIIAEGWHEKAGEPHAEVNALQSLENPNDAKGTTVYVTLEPCCHQGRTPPCTKALIEAGVSRVIIAAQDPNPLVDGCGIEMLKAAGIEVISGVLKHEANQQNEIFCTNQLKNRPFVLYKTAMTLDGKIATRTGQSRWITEGHARKRVQQWRNELDGIVVGVNTVLLDDPLLTTRLEGGRTPIKIIFDSVARTPIDVTLFNDDPEGYPARVIIFVTEKAVESRVSVLKERGAEVICLPELRGRADVRTALSILHEKEVSSLLLEGGGTLAWSFFEAQAVDKVAWFIGAKLVGGAGSSPLGGLGVATMDDAIKLDNLNTEFIGTDILILGEVSYQEDVN